MYTSSHDVVQDNGEGQDVGYRVFGEFQKPFTVLQFTVYGTPVIYSAQEINYQGGKEILSEKSTIDWTNPDLGTEEFYKKLIWLKHNNPSLKTGHKAAAYKNLTTSNQDRIMAYQRGQGKEALVVMLNLSDQPVYNFTVNELPEGNFKELFSGENAQFSNKQSFSLPPFGYMVYFQE